MAQASSRALWRISLYQRWKLVGGSLIWFKVKSFLHNAFLNVPVYGYLNSSQFPFKFRTALPKPYLSIRVKALPQQDLLIVRVITQDMVVLSMLRKNRRNSHKNRLFLKAWYNYLARQIRLLTGYSKVLLVVKRGYGFKKAVTLSSANVAFYSAKCWERGRGFKGIISRLSELVRKDYLKGFRIQVSGRIRGSLRARKRNWQLGKISSSNLVTWVDTNQYQALTKWGVLGIRVSFYFDPESWSRSLVRELWFENRIWSRRLRSLRKKPKLFLHDYLVNIRTTRYSKRTRRYMKKKGIFLLSQLKKSKKKEKKGIKT